MKTLKTIVVIGFIAGQTLTAFAQNEDSKARDRDSTRHVYRAWNKITFQMKRFNEVVVGYVKAINKAEPSDTNITREVSSYSDSLDIALNNAHNNDSQSITRVRAMFDSLVRSSVRLIQKVENDTGLRSNKTIRQMNAMMDSVKDKINKYQEELNQTLKRKGEATDPEDEPKPEPASPKR